MTQCARETGQCWRGSEGHWRFRLPWCELHWLCLWPACPCGAFLGWELHSFILREGCRSQCLSAGISTAEGFHELLSLTILFEASAVLRCRLKPQFFGYTVLVLILLHAIGRIAFSRSVFMELLARQKHQLTEVVTEQAFSPRTGAVLVQSCGSFSLLCPYIPSTAFW